MTFKFELAEIKKVELPDGKKIEVREPNIREIREFRQKHKDCGDDDEKQLEVTIDFLDSLGFPKEIAYQSSDSKLLGFIRWLTDGKKS